MERDVKPVPSGGELPEMRVQTPRPTGETFKTRVSGRSIAELLGEFGLREEEQSRLPLDEAYRRLPRAARRRLHSRLERTISRQVGSNAAGAQRISRRMLRKSAALAASTLLGLILGQPSEANVVVQDSADFLVEVFGPDNVRVACDPVSRLVTVESGGTIDTYSTFCQDLNSLTLDASGSTATATLDLSAIRSTDLGSVATVTLTLLASPHGDTLTGPADLNGTVTVTIIGGGGNDSVTVGTAGAPPTQTNSGTVTINTGGGDDDVLFWRRGITPLATAADASIDLGDGDNTLLAVSDNVSVLGGANTDDVTLCGCWGSVDSKAGADQISNTGFNTVLLGGDGSDAISQLEVCDTATATITIVAPAPATVEIDGQDGIDAVDVELAATASVTVTVLDTGSVTGVDSATITGSDQIETISTDISSATTTITIAGSSPGGVEVSNFATATIHLGNEPTVDGDSLTLEVLSPPSFDLTIDGGDPAAGATPGDSLVWVGTGRVPVSGFETITVASAVPATGLGGLLAVGASIVAGAWARLRRRREA